MYLIILALALFLLMVTINLPAFDEELLPEVQAIKNIKAEPFDENNAYPAMWAFASPKDQPFEVTVNELRTYINQKIQQQGVDILSLKENKELAGQASETSWKNQYAKCNSREDITCMRQYIDQLNGQTIDDARLQQLLSRYERLIAYENFSEAVTIDINSPVMGYGTLLSIKRIFLAQIYHQQPSKNFIEMVLRDLAFWRMVLANSNYILTKMIAVSTIRDSIFVLSEAVADERLNKVEMEKLKSHLNGLSKTEFDMSETFKYEMKYSMTVIDQYEKEESIGWTPWINFYQKQATNNTNYLYVIKPLIETAKLNSQMLYQKVKNDDDPSKSPVSWTPAMIYNPTGKLLTSFSISVYDDYFGRVHDLNGMILLLKLRLEIASKQDQNVTLLVQTSEHVNPYTGEAMNYDPKEKKLFFKCLSRPYDSCEIQL